MQALGWVSIKMAASLARLNRQTIYRWMKQNRLKWRTIGGRYYISTKSLQEEIGELADVEPGSP